MSVSNTEGAALQAVRELEKVRIVAIRDNDADAMAGILDEKFIYINGSGKIYSLFSFV